MRKINHMMVDMETLSTYKDSSILTIGAILFSPYNDDRDKVKDGEIQMRTFYRRVCLDSCDRLGLREDPSTIEWWGQQGEHVMEEAFAEDDRHPIEDVLSDLSRFANTAQYPWSNGAGFDIPILEVVYEKLNRKEPWSFWNSRDCRTIYDVGNVRLKTVTNSLNLDQAHHALYDCYCQIIAVQEAYRNLGLTDGND